MRWGDYGWGWGMGFGWFFIICFAIIAVAGIILITKKLTAVEKKEEETAVDILKERYAKGEISKEYFDRIKKDIED